MYCPCPRQKKDYGHHNYPLERIEKAICWLKEHGNKQIAITGASTTGMLALVGAEDDGLWDTAKYIRRMEARLQSRPHSCEYVACVYPHGTHFIFPEKLLKKIFPVGADWLIQRFFSVARKYPAECKATRVELDEKIGREILNWER